MPETEQLFLSDALPQSHPPPALSQYCEHREAHTLLPPAAVGRRWAHRTLPQRKAKAHWQICPAASSEAFPVQPSGLAGSCWETKGRSSESRQRNTPVSVYLCQLHHSHLVTNASRNRWHCVRFSICKVSFWLPFFVGHFEDNDKLIPQYTWQSTICLLPSLPNAYWRVLPDIVAQLT